MAKVSHIPHTRDDLSGEPKLWKPHLGHFQAPKIGKVALPNKLKLSTILFKTSMMRAFDPQTLLL